MSGQDIAELGFAVDTSDVKQATKDLDGLDKAGKNVETSATRLEKIANKVYGIIAQQMRAAGQSISNTMRDMVGSVDTLEKKYAAFEIVVAALTGNIYKLGRALALNSGEFRDHEKEVSATAKAYNLLKIGLAVLGIGLGIQQLMDYSNQYGQLRGQLALNTASSHELNDAWRDLYNISQNTAQSLAGTIELYSRLARSTKSLGLTQKELVSVVDTVNKTLLISKAPAASAEAALFQLSQGLAAGALRGDELNSVMEQTPRLSQAIADGIGVSVGALRNMGAEGKITSEVIISALQRTKTAVNDEFGSVFVSLNNAMSRVDTSMVQLVGRADEAAGASRVFGEQIAFFTEKLERPETLNGLTAVLEKMATALNIVAYAVQAVFNHLTALLTLFAAYKLIGLLFSIAQGFAFWNLMMTGLNITIGSTTLRIPALLGGIISLGNASAQSAAKVGVLALALKIAGGPIGLLMSLLAIIAPLYLIFASHATTAQDAQSNFNKELQATGSTAEDYIDALSRMDEAQKKILNNRLDVQLGNQTDAMKEQMSELKGLLSSEIFSTGSMFEKRGTNSDRAKALSSVDATIKVFSDDPNEGAAAVEKLISTYEDLAKKAGTSEESIQKTTLRMREMTDAARQAARDIETTKGKLGLLKDQTDETAKSQVGLGVAYQTSGSLIADNGKKLDDQLAKLKQAAVQAGLTAEALARLQVKNQGGTAADQDLAGLYSTRKEALDKYRKALDAKRPDVAGQFANAAMATIPAEADIAANQAGAQFDKDNERAMAIAKQKGDIDKINAMGVERLNVVTSTYLRTLLNGNEEVKASISGTKQQVKENQALQKLLEKDDSTQKYLDNAEAREKADSKMADALLLGADAARKVGIQNAIAEKETQKLKVTKQQLTDIENKAQDTKDRLSVAQSVFSMREQNEALEKQIAATKAGEEALKAFNNQKAFEAALRGKNIVAGSKEAIALQAEIDKKTSLDKQLDDASKGNAYDKTLDGMERQRIALESESKADLDLTKSQIDLNVVKAVANEKANNKDLSSDQLKAYEKEIRAMEEVKDHLERLEKARELLKANPLSGIADGLKTSFGDAGAALSGLIESVIELQKKREDSAKIEKALQADIAKGDANAINAAIANRRDLEKATNLQYANMASAAKGFFKENSKGYKAMEGVERAFRLFELLMAAQSAAKKIFLDKGVVAAKVAGDNIINQSTIASGGIISKIMQMLGLESAKTAVASSATGDPYTAFPRMAAMIAAMAALGFAVNGGGGTHVPSSETRQAEQGTGTVLGDTAAKSESIAKAMELLRQNSDVSLKYSSDMLASLRSIDSGIRGLGGILSRSGIATGNMSGFTQESKTGLLDVLGLNGQGSEKRNGILGFLGGGPIGAMLSAPLAKLVNSIYSKKVTIEDSGIQGFAQKIGDIMSKGFVDLQYYNEIRTTKKVAGVKVSDKTSIETRSADNEVERQFGLIIDGIYGSVLDAATILGGKVADIDAKLKDTVVNFGMISLKGLSGDALSKALESVFSALGDNIAKSIMPTVDEFQQVGEGYYQTLVRVAAGVEQAGLVTDKLGLKAISYSDIINKQGDVAAELTRQSILGVEKLGDGLTGIGDIISSLDGTATDLADVYIKLTALRNIMVDTGQQGQYLTRTIIQAAGGLDALTEGLNIFQREFGTEFAKSANDAVRLSDKFAQLGIAMPTTRDQFKSLVDAVDLTSEAGQRLYGKLISLAPAFVEYLTAVDKITSFNADIQRQLATYTASGVDIAMQELESSFNDLRKQAANVGGDLVAVEELYGSRRAETLDKYAEMARKIDFDLAVRQAKNNNQDTTLAALEEQQRLEYKAAVAAKYTSEQLAALAAVLDGEFSSAVDKLALSIKQKNIDIQKRLAVFGTTEERMNAALAEFDLKAAQELQDATRMGADIVGLEKALMLERNKVAEDFYADQKKMADDFRKWLDAQKFSDTSSLTPLQQLQAAQEQFNETLSKARGGDTQAQQDILSKADTLLKQGRDYYASGAGFTDMEQFIRLTIENLGKQLALPGFAVGTPSAPSGWAVVGERGPELVNFKGGERVFNNNQTNNMANQSGDNSNVVRAIVITGNKQAEKLDNLGEAVV